MNDPRRAEPNLVRPYSLTSGRTRPKVELAWEARIERLPGGDPDHELTDVETAIVALTTTSPSIAEVAAQVGVPIGVARILVADLVESGYVRIMATLREDSSDDERRGLIERTLSGLLGI